tara:strand:- start:51 stop:914 length:864 start_codon:yes stop_codon:yes gene_type:complete
MKEINKSDFEWIDEYQNGVRYGLEGKILINQKTKFQDIKVIDSKRYGKGLLLDNCWMTTERQEKSYHECLVHPALCGSKQLNKVLIIGGGDGGSARECLRHESIQFLDMVEIDEKVVELSKKYLPGIGGSAWNDSRLNLKFEDGIKWVKQSEENTYDVIIVDGSDPKGPAKGLFNKTFFEHCKRILTSGGVLATQSESPESFFKAHIEIIKTLRKVFDYADPLYGSVPIYPSGWWSWTFACDKKARYLSPIEKRALEIAEQCHVWSPRWQKGAFNSIPALIEKELKR